MGHFELTRDGTRLACLDLGGSGPPVLLVHGLAGHSGEWRASVPWLSAHHRVFAFDQRGHGRSERRPTDLSRRAFAEDCAAVIKRMGLGRVTLVGQSMGSNTALLTACAHSAMVERLVMLEGSPDGPEPPVDREPIAQQQSERLAA